MLIIDTREKIAALRASGHHLPALLDLIAERMAGVVAAYAEAGVAWDPAEHGAFAILEEGDGPADFDSVGLNPEEGLAGACWEFCFFHSGSERAYEVLHLFANDGGWTFFVPCDAPWLGASLKSKLESEATEPFATAMGGGEAEGSPF